MKKGWSHNDHPTFKNGREMYEDGVKGTSSQYDTFRL